MSQSKVSKIETGRLLPSVADIEALADALRVPAEVKASLVDQTTALQSELHTWRALHRPSFRRHQQEIRRAELDSTTIRLFQPNIIPGLLQTAEYARHAIAAYQLGPDEMTDAVASRVERQAILYDESKSFAFVITEGALRWRMGPTPVHLAALDRVANLSTLRNVALGIIPWTIHAPTLPTNMFLAFDDRMVTVETIHGELTLKEPGDIALYLTAFDTLASLARHDDEARAILAGIATDLRGLGN
jgi:transcriptional regulator with XRE-family HTH domain